MPAASDARLLVQVQPLCWTPRSRRFWFHAPGGAVYQTVSQVKLSYDGWRAPNDSSAEMREVRVVLERLLRKVEHEVKRETVIRGWLEKLLVRVERDVTRDLLRDGRRNEKLAEERA